MKHTFIVLLITCSCNWINRNWISFEGKGLPNSDDSYETIVFDGKEHGFLGGHRLTILSSNSKTIHFINHAVLYETKNKGKTWNQIKLGIVGSIEQIFVFGDTLNLLSQDSQSDSIFILTSFDRGGSWNKIFRCSSLNYIRKIDFESAKKGHFVIEDSVSRFFVTYKNGNWDTVKNISTYDYKLDVLGRTIFSLISEDIYSRGVLISDIYNAGEYKVLFDKKYVVSEYITSDNHFYVCLENKNSSKIMKVDRNGRFSYIHLGKFEQYSINKMYHHGNTFVLIVNQKTDVGPIGVDMKLLISKDNGKTWELEKFPFSLVTSPAFLYKDQFFITSCSANMFQLRKLKSTH